MAAVADDFEKLLEIQRLMASRIVQEQEQDLKIKILTILGQLTTSKRKKIQKEAIIIEASLQGISEEDVLLILDKLKTEGIIKEKDGYVELI
ncbi:hypothetical protein J7L02_03255 [Candidatus Woesearchaeota archaeon]|nr:hypothetical protein [Candidatus Woesearchaeota archaeon]